MNDSQTESAASFPASDDVPSVGNLLSALDFEIGRISSERQRPGWSLWAVYGGLASAVWLLFEQLEQHAFTWLVVLQVFLVFSVSKELGLSFKRLLERPISTKFQPARFKFLYETENRVRLVLAIALNVTLVVIAIVTRARVSWFSEIVMLIFLGGNVIFATLSLIRSFSRALNRVGEDFSLPFPYSLIGISVECLFNFIFLAAALGYAFAAVESRPIIADLRVAALLFVIALFLPLLVREDEHVPLLSSLQELRRDVALSRVAVSTAVSRMDEILVGMQAPRAFQKDLQEILDTIESIITRSERVISISEGYQEIVEGLEEETFSKLWGLLKPEHDDILEEKRRLVKKETSLRKRIDRLVLLNPYLRVELTELLDSIQEREGAIEPIVNSMSSAIGALEELHGKLSD